MEEQNRSARDRARLAAAARFAAELVLPDIQSFRNGYNEVQNGSYLTGTGFVMLGVFQSTPWGKPFKLLGGVTRSSRNRVKRLVKTLSDNSRQNNGLSQEKTDQLRRIVKKAGGRLRNDGVSGQKGSSAGKPHVQTEGLGKIDKRHIWTREGVQ